MNLYDCHGGPGTTEPACGACVTCLHRVIEQKDQRIKRLEEALEECDWAFTKFCPEHESRYGDAWEKVRDALNRPNPFKPYWPEENQ